MNIFAQGTVLSRVYEQPLYQTRRLKPNTGGYVHFFTGDMADHELLNNCEQYRGGCPGGIERDIKRIGLTPGANTKAADFHRAIQNGTLYLDNLQYPILKIPAIQAAWANIKEINTLLFSLRKLPQAQQDTIIRNLKVAEGYALENPIKLRQHEAFRLRLEIYPAPVLKKEIQIMCVLGGTERRGVY